MFQFLPMAIGGGLGLLTSKDPLQGAVTGAALGGLTGGLGGATPAAGTGLQAGGAAMAGSPGLSAGTAGTGLLAGSGAPGMTMAAGAGTQLSAAGTPAASGLAGIFNKDNLQTASNVAGLAGQMGIFDDPQQAPAAQSAGIPARQADFSGLLRSQGQANNAADVIDRALDTGKVFTGPGANVQMTVTQMADALGMTGADQKEKLKNTRETIQGLAQLTLQGRQQMRGQGAITDSESKLAERAISGDVSLTAQELRVLTNAARRSGQHVYQEHQRKAQVIQSNPDYAPMAPFYNVPPMQQPPQQPQAAPASGGWGIQKVN